MEEKFDILGRLTWLWMNSPLHNDWPIYLLSRFALPPIELNQYLLLERDGMPVAYCSWAFITAETEKQYILNPSELNLSNWHGGDRLWFIDWVAPFAKRDSFSLRTALAKKFPNEVARAIRVKKGSERGRVMEFKGKDIDKKTARENLNRSYADFLNAVATKNTMIGE